MRLLLIHTCGLEGVVALAEDGLVVAVEHLPGRGSSEHLMPAIRRLMEAQGWRVRELAAVVVVTGPGSFTGVRVGLAAAKGLCEAGAVGLIALSRLALVAAASTGAEASTGIALLDAGRGEYYCGLYREGVALGEQLLELADVLPLLAADRAATCEVRVAQSLGTGVDLVPEPGPQEMLAMAASRIAAGDWSDVALTDANYMRRTDAELLVKG